MLVCRRFLVAVSLGAFLGSMVLADDELELFELEDLLNAETSLASQKARTVRESPGIITIVTRDEIQASGARDLIDVLQWVPGFSFGHDVEGVVGLGFRGNWGYEGKILLMVDGIPQNELLYSTHQLGNHYPVDQLERIEIIRGPGSASYGGWAELAVINLVTRGPKELDGGALSAYVGQMGGSLGRRNLAAAFGKLFDQGRNLGFSIAGFVGHGQRGTGDYTDFEGDTYSLDENSDLDPFFVNALLTVGDLRLRVLHDRYTMSERDSFGTNLARPVDMDFVSTQADLRYDVEVGEHVKISPRLTYTRQEPWRVPDKSVDDYYDKLAERLAASIAGTYDNQKNFSVTVGAEWGRDHAEVNGTEEIGSQTLFDGDTSVDYDNLALFGEATYQGSFGNLLVGARYDRHSVVKDSFVPRIAYTKVFGAFNLKALYSEAFRAPGIENINLQDPANPIRPEQTRVIELELGYQAGAHVYLSANVFDITIDDPIVYFFDPVEESEHYVNFSRTGTRGLEAGANFRYPWGFANVSYSYYTAAGKNEVGLYEVPGTDAALLGMPQHRFAAATSFKVWKGLSINPSLTWIGERYAYVGLDEEEESILGKTDAVVLANLFVNYRDLGVKGLDVGLGVYDLTDEEYAFIQPYGGGKPPLPGPSREYVVRIKAHF